MSDRRRDFHARTLPLEYGPDALEFDGSPTVLFDRPGLTLVGWGTALLVEASEAAATLATIECEDAVQRPGTGVLALGALPFLDTMAGQLIVPRFTMGVSRDPDGTVQRWATVVGPVDDPLPEVDELFDAVIWQYGAADGGAAPGDVEVAGISTSLSSEGYMDLVASAVATMGAPRAELHKVVLSRTITATLDGPLPLAVVLRRMRANEPNCTVFSMPVPEGTFFGASPELLVARQGRHVSCHPLAGTIARGETARSDADAQGRLAHSSKDHDEHRYVTDDIARVLAPLCTTLTVPPEPSLVAFRTIVHLGTRIEGELSGPTSILELLEQLHPTAAVGGTPRPLALATIAAGEPVRRDYWAGPVGWVDADGNGRWVIGLRSASLLHDGQTVTLHAGAGIVADSVPDEEASEVNVKLATVLESLVPGGSERLR